MENIFFQYNFDLFTCTIFAKEREYIQAVNTWTFKVSAMPSISKIDPPKEIALFMK